LSHAPSLSILFLMALKCILSVFYQNDIHFQIHYKLQISNALNWWNEVRHQSLRKPRTYHLRLCVHSWANLCRFVLGYLVCQEDS
jgi:hypothetical protein